MKTPDEITTDIFRYVKQSALASAVTGKIINGKDRTPDSTKEDVTVKILANNLGQLQGAYINVNIYVADTQRGGQYQKDDVRVPLLERTALDVFEKPFHLNGARVVIDSQTTFPSQNGKEHIINNKLLYHIVNE